MEAELARRFHELTATSAVELSKTFNKYLKDLRDVADLKWDEYVRLLSPGDRQQEMFRLKILRAFERWDELIDIFLQANVPVNKVLLKDRRFVALFAEMTPDRFVNDICPHISHVTRRNLLYEMSFFIGTNGEAYYDAVLEKYGAKTARQLLAASDPLGAKLNDRQLVHLHKRSPDVCSRYFEDEDIAKYPGFARYLCLSDVHTFRKLRKTPMSYGKKMFVNYLSHYKEDVVSDPLHFLPKRHKLVYKHLTLDEYFLYFKSLISQYPDEIDHFLRECASAVPPRERGRVVGGLLRSLYGIDMWSTVAFVDAEFLKLLPLHERLKFVDLDDEHVEVNSTKISVAALKVELANVTYTDERSTLCYKLVDTCLINKDLAALLEVLRYFDENFDRCDIMERGMTCLALNDLAETLSAECWKYIHSYLEKIDDGYDYVKELLWEKSIVYCFRNNLDFKRSLISYLKGQTYEIYYVSIKEQYLKQCIVAFPELIPVLYSGEADRRRAQLEFLEWAARYNSSHRNDRIDLHTYSKYALSDLTETVKYTAFVRDFLIHEPTTNEAYRGILQQVLDSHRFDDFFNRFHLSDLLQLYKRRPDVFDGCRFERFFSRGGSREFFDAVSKTPRSNVSAELGRLSTAILEDPDAGVGSITAAFTFLSFDDSFDVLTQLGRHLPDRNVPTQKRMIAALKNSSRPWTNIDGLVELCDSGYLESAVSTLHHALLHAPEKLLVEPVPTLRIRRERRGVDEELFENNDREERGNYSSRIEFDDRSNNLML